MPAQGEAEWLYPATFPLASILPAFMGTNSTLPRCYCSFIMVRPMISVKRVMILGGSGAGKTHLTMKLSEQFRLPRHHVDQLSWQPGFIHRTAEELDVLTRRIHADRYWVLEGGHYETGHDRAQRAQLLIWVDPRTIVQTWRVVQRSWRYHGKVRPGMGEGCQEWFGKRTVEAVTYARASRDFHRERALDIIANAPPSLNVLHLRTARHVRSFLRRTRALPDGPGFAFSPQPSADPRVALGACA